MKISKAVLDSLAKTDKTQQITSVKAVEPVTPAKYVVTECFNVLKNLWLKPKYETLIITSRAWMKLIAYIHLIGGYEISGFGRIIDTTYDEKPAHKVIDFKIIKQEVKEAYVESSEDAVMDFIRRTPLAEQGQWVLDWHSHVNMSTSPSGTDWNNYNEMLTARMGNQFPAMIVNKKNSVTAICFMSESKHPDINVFIEEMENITEEELRAIYEECKKDIEENCTKAVVVTTYSNTGWANSNYRDSRVGYGSRVWNGYGYDYYDDDDDDMYSAAWTRQQKKTEEIEEDEDEEIAEAKKQGFVFEEVEEEQMLDACPYCGSPLDYSDPDVHTWGVCAECLKSGRFAV